MTAISDANKRNPSPVLDILLLCDDGTWNANNQLDHIRSFIKYSAHNIFLFNPCFLRKATGLDLNEFDVVVIHWSIIVNNLAYLSEDLRNRIRSYQGLKVQLLQDDYRQVDEFSAHMRDLGIQVLYTLVPEDQIPKVWTEQRLPGVTKISTFAGYVPNELRAIPSRPISSRPIDVGYRGRKIPYWLGKLGQDKVWIGEGFLAHTGRSNLRCDISSREEDRIYGKDWIRFLQSCKCVLGTEGGASIVDFDGSVEKRVRAYLAEQPNASFWDVHDKILAPFEGNVRFNVISPRIFEAAALRTAMILFKGDYSGVAKPWVHYIPLEKDFSNIDEVVKKVQDLEYLKLLTDRAYADLCSSDKYTLKEFIRGFDAVMGQLAKPRSSESKSHYQIARALRLPTAWRITFQVSLRNIRWLQPLKMALRHSVYASLILSVPLTRGILEEWILRMQRRTSFFTLFQDLLVLAMLYQIRRDKVALIEPFRTNAQYDPKLRRLTIRSSRSETIPEKESLPSLIKCAEIKEVWWDHSAVSESVSFPILRQNQMSIPIGSKGIHQFSSISALGGRTLSRVCATLIHKGKA